MYRNLAYMHVHVKRKYTQFVGCSYRKYIIVYYTTKHIYRDTTLYTILLCLEELFTSEFADTFNNYSILQEHITQCIPI